MISAIFSKAALKGGSVKKLVKRPAIGPQLIGIVISDTISISLEGPSQRLPFIVVSGLNRLTEQAHLRS